MLICFGNIFLLLDLKILFFCMDVFCKTYINYSKTIFFGWFWSHLWIYFGYTFKICTHIFMIFEVKMEYCFGNAETAKWS